MRLQKKNFQLKNGVRVLGVSSDNVESVVAMVWIKTGSRNEDDNELGISHVVEHMLFKGTKKYPTPLSLASTVDAMGAEFNAFTEKEYTAYYIKSTYQYLQKSLEILSEMILYPRLGEDELEREKKVIIEEIKMYEDQPRDRVMEEFGNLMFKGNKLGRPIIGYKEIVEKMSRTKLRRYMNKWYKGENILVLLVGKLNLKEINSVVEEYFSSVEFGKLEPYAEEGRYGKDRNSIIEKKTEQTHFVVGVPGLDLKDERRYIELILKVVLGGNMSSRLFTEVREKRGLAYYVYSLSKHFYDVGYLGARAGVRKDKFDEALSVTEEQMLHLKDTIKNDEIERARSYLLGKLSLSLENSVDVAYWMGSRAVSGISPEDPREVIDKVKGVKLNEVKELADDLFKKDEFRSAIVR